MVTGNEYIRRHLEQKKYTWLVTGAAGFIGSHLVEALLTHQQRVIAVDNFITGHKRNIDEVKNKLPQASSLLEFTDGDIRDPKLCQQVVKGVDFVLHQAALGSVPRSLEAPEHSHDHNVNGFMQLLNAARTNGKPRIVYASSSSVYGDHPGLPKVEDEVGAPQSPYAATKKIDEIYAQVFAKSYAMELIGLRYFNVFGERQDPEGPYAAVIPRWIKALVKGESVEIYGDGDTSRDFCYVKNVAQANLLAALSKDVATAPQVYNIAVGTRTTLNELHKILVDLIGAHLPNVQNSQPAYKDFRAGDVRHSLADISRAQQFLRYEPTHSLAQGLKEAMSWYLENL